MDVFLNNATNAILDKMRIYSEEIRELIIIYIGEIRSRISSDHTIIITLVSIAIASTIIMGTTILIRQRKILRKLDELTKQTPQIPEKGDNGHAE